MTTGKYPRRLAHGGRIDRDRPLCFTFNGRSMLGFVGDTVASALMANGVDVVARSFKYHRPRGFFGGGRDDPSAMVAIRDAYGYDAAVRASQVQLADGMDVRTTTGWPSVAFDVGGLVRPFAPFIKAGFYYKTFKWPNWRWFEPLIRRATGFGRVDPNASPRPAERLHAVTDVLIVGGGIAGISAAAELRDSSLDVMLADERPVLGGAAGWGGGSVGGTPVADFVRTNASRINASDNIQVLNDTVVTGAYEGNFFTLSQCVHADDGARLLRHWKVRADKVILATGSTERPLVFEGNDIPGVMLASAVTCLIEEYAVAPAGRLAVFTNNDLGYATALSASRAGIEVVAVIDVRTAPPAQLSDELEAAGITLLTGSEVVRAVGRGRVRGVDISPLDGGARIHLTCDGLAVSGGTTPLVHLAAHRGMKPVYEPAAAAFVPAELPADWYAAGDVLGPSTPDTAVAAGRAVGCAVLGKDAPVPVTTADPQGIQPHWRAQGGDTGKMFVDLQNDVTVADIELAASEGYVSVEHLKRYTTLGMGTDQGRTSNINGLALLAEQTDREIADVGTTTFRPPYTAVPMSAIAANRTGTLYRAPRVLPAHAIHKDAGAVFEDVGWQRPDWYRDNGVDREAAVNAEMSAVRNAVGLFDGSPLGKIEIAGPDARRFLDRFYVSNLMTLKPGRVRYSVMLHEDGVIFDDGVVTCVDDNLFIAGPSSGNADAVAAWFERWRQTEWPTMRVAVAPVTSQWASFAIAGPHARELLTALKPDFDVSGDAFPHMAYREGELDGMPARVSRVSFTGELQYEINVPAANGLALLERVIAVSNPMGGRLVGLEAWLRLRLEKGYLHVGADTNGRTTPLDIGMAGIVAKKPADFIGRRSLSLPYAVSAAREELVGLRCVAGVLRVGGRVLAEDASAPPCKTVGYVTSACHSPSLGYHVGLALIENGSRRLGEPVRIYDDGAVVDAEICRPGPYDPENERLKA